MSKNILISISLLLVNFFAYAGDTGNWYEKLQWWKKAKPLYESVKERNAEVQAVKAGLIKSQKKLVDVISDFYKRARINKSETLNTINKLIESYSDFKDEAILNKLEKLKSGLEEILHIDKQAKESGRIIDQQSSMGEHYQEKALQSFEDIEAVYDDKKARSYYEIIENCRDNLELVLNYLNHDLRLFLNTVLGKVQTLSESVEQTIEYLERENIEIKYFTPEEKEAKEKARLEEEKEKAHQKKLELEELAIKNRPWWKKVMDYIIDLIKKIFRLS